MIPFPFNENRFSFFFFPDHLLVGQLCRNPKSDRSLLSCLKVTQRSTSEIGDAPLYNSCSLPIQVMITGPLPAPANANHDCSTLEGTAQRIWRPFGRLRLWSLVWFQVRATSCHLISSKSAWKSARKCTWMCWRVWWSPGAIRWPVANPGSGSRTRHRPTSPKRSRLGFKRSDITLYLSLTGPLLPRPEHGMCKVKGTIITTIGGIFRRYSKTGRTRNPRKIWNHQDRCDVYWLINFIGLSRVIFMRRGQRIKFTVHSY